jgi:hypothetical protein
MVEVNANGARLTHALLDFALAQTSKAAFVQVAPDGQAELLAGELAAVHPDGLTLRGLPIFFDGNVPEGQLLLLDDAKNVLVTLLNFVAPVADDLSGVTVTTI